MILDRNLPFELQLELQKATPKESIGVGYGFSSSGQFTSMVVPETNFTKTKTLRFATKKEAEKLLSTIKDGTWCIKCSSHPRDCTKRLFKKWD
jgi:hypothetical protein